MYLDDGTSGADIDRASSHSRAVRKDLAMNTLVNEEKSNFVPRHRARVLGLIVDASLNCITASTERVGKVYTLVCSIFSASQNVSACKLAQPTCTRKEGP